MKEYAVQTQKLVKAFNGIDIIRECNMNVEKGQIYGLLGVNGVGKTTLFKMMLGLFTPTAGRIEILGYDISKNKNEILRNTGCIIEVPNFYEHLSARKNLEIHLEYMGLNNSNVEASLDMVGLGYINEQPVSKFSLGMRQRLGIARAISHKPQLLILDEPTNGLDPLGIRELREVFLKLAHEHNMTILISSHILSEVEHMADIVGVLAGGRIVEEVAIHKIKEKYPNGLEDYFFNLMSGGKKYV